jgi:hypothetical protein
MTMAKTRRRQPSLPRIEDLYGAGISGNLLRGEYTYRADVRAALQRRHERGVSYIDKDGYWSQNGRRWRVPYGVRVAFEAQLTFDIIANKYPFYVQWHHPSRNGGPPRTMRRSCSSLGSACAFATRVSHIDSDVFIVVKNGFYIPRALMGKFPRRLADGRLYYWCPRCMQPRTMRRTVPDDIFYVNKKYLIDGQYEWKNVKLAVLECSHCGITNRDRRFRASNQPVEKVRLRARPRRRRGGR